MIIKMLAGYSAVFALMAAVVCHAEWRKYYIGAKVLNSLAFLAVFFASTYLSGEVMQFWLMLPAFFCCFAGDIFMAAYNRCRKRVHFLMGLWIFLAGHLCFTRWLAAMQAISAIDLCLPILAVLLTWYLVSRRDIHTGRLKPFILLYAFFVALFFVKGQHLAIADPSVSHIMTAVGSTLFLISDISILFVYFRKNKNIFANLFNLATYYYGMFFLASQLLFL